MLVATAPLSVSPPPSSSLVHSCSSSSLNPHFKGTVSVVAYSSSSSSSSSSSVAANDTKTHLSNLDRILSKPSAPQPPQTTTHDNNDHDANSGSAGRSGGGGRGGRGGGGGGGGIFNALSLIPIPIPIPSGLFPLQAFGRQATDGNDQTMSPRSMAHLQRLLSESPRPSPRSSIAAEWRRYHGADSWDGLLDPLHPNLRRELLRYGDFVQSAYNAFHSPTASSSSLHRHVVLPDRSYRATRSLYATSSLALPAWADSHPSAPEWLRQRSSWVGFVAVCDSDREIARMGRRDIAVVLRGTATCHEWAENLRASLVPLPPRTPNSGSAAEGDRAPRVARGFLSLYETPGDDVPSLSSSIIDEVRRLLRLYEGEELSITVVGHSLGAALALLAADELRACAPRAPPIAVVSFGGPKVGDGAFADRLRRCAGAGAGAVNVLRVVNESDVVTRVPVGAGALAGLRGYEHARGAELRVDSRDSPCLRPDAGPVCSHDLEAYLHLVDGFAGSGREFRPDASRSVVRLLRHQRPSIKKVYAARARALRLDRPPDIPPPEPYGYVASPS